MFRAKKIALAVAMAAATMSMAQATEVEVFGRFDTGMMYTINSGDSKDNFQMTSGHTTGSPGVSRPQKSLTLTGLLGLIWSRALNPIPVNCPAPTVSLVVR